MSHDSTSHTDATGEPEVRLLHTSDWHLGAPRSWGSDARFKLSDSSLWIDRLWSLREKAIESIVDKALSGRCHAVLVAGDVFDHPDLGAQALQRVEAFLRTQVIERLAARGIALILTPGTHDYRPGKPLETVRRFHALAQEYREAVCFIVPGRSRIRLGVDTATVGHLLVAPDTPGRNTKTPWVEFLHNRKDSSGQGNPLYRAFGDRHYLTTDLKRGAYHPGSPFVRTTGTDGAGAGPRFVISVAIRGSRVVKAEAEQLPVAETAVLKKMSRTEWQLFYNIRDPADRPQWSGSVGGVLEMARKGLPPQVAFLTLVLGQEELASTVSRCWTEAGEWGKGQTIPGSRAGIISVWLR